MKILLQPARDEREAYLNVAGREKLGFEVMELSLPAPYADAAAWYASTGKAVSLHGAFMDNNPVSGEKEIRELSRQLCEQSCRDALRCGAESVIFHSSCFPFLRGGYLENWLRRAAEFYAALAEKTGLRILLENSFDLDPEPLERLMKLVRHPLLGVCLDLGHVNYSRTPQKEWFDRLGEYVRALHLSDNAGSFDEHLPLGAGSVDWEEADRLAAFLPECAAATLEVNGIDGAVRSLAYLEEHRLFGRGA